MGATETRAVYITIKNSNLSQLDSYFNYRTGTRTFYTYKGFISLLRLSNFSFLQYIKLKRVGASIIQFTVYPITETVIVSLCHMITRLNTCFSEA